MDSGRIGRTGSQHQRRLLTREALALVAWTITGGAGVTAACTGQTFESCVEKRTCGSEGESGGTGGDDGAGGGGAGEGLAAAGVKGEGSAGEGSAGTGSAGVGSIGDGSAGDGSAGEDSGGGRSAGDGGMAGVAGMTSEPECEADSDCSDGLYCTGDEACIDGACVAGTAPCLEASEHCVIECIEEQESCAVSAADSDGDDHGSDACEEAPGDDCDDDEATVHPGTRELCDGLDNDCDGLADLSDGLGLAGRTRVHATAHDADIAWSPESQTFSVVQVHSGVELEQNVLVSTIEFASLLPSGAVAAAVATVGGPARGQLFRDPSIAWGEDRYGVVMTRESSGGYYRVFVPVTTDGTPGESTLRAGSAHEIAWDPTWMWVIAGQEPPDSENEYLEVDNATASSATLLETVEARGSKVRIASGEGRAALIWVSEEPNESGAIKWARSSGLGLTPPDQLTDAGLNPDVAVTPIGYALAWASAQWLHLTATDAGGSLVCSPTTVPIGSSVATDAAVSLAVLGDTVLALVTHASGTVELLRFDAECRLLERAFATQSAVTPSRPRLAVGGGFVALAWNEATEVGSSQLRTRTRLVTDSLCK